MKKVKLLLMIFAALLVAQVSNAQVVHTTFIEDPGFIYCLDEPVFGQLHYRNTIHLDKSGAVKKLFFHNIDSWFEGAISGDMYKVVDVGSTIPDYFWPFPVPEDGVEFTLINNMKIIAKGTGKVYSGRVQLKFFFDKEGNLVVKKDINTTCFE
ncbi:MAG: hypothetical protein KAR17_11225 [Cyclobacteriaceae bacterium]|nr:hypothetical protein [Cyclobacteriaceae bacterium]